MASITTRAGKGSPLTNTEVDDNFTNLNTDKVEKSGDSMTGNLSFGDNDKAQFGAGNDLQIYHDGSHSYIKDAGTGSLYVQGSHMFLTDADGNEYLRLSDQGTGGTVYIKHNGATKLATTSTGIDVTGTVTADGLTQTNGAGTLTVKDLGGSSNEIEATGTLHIDYQGSNFQVINNTKPRLNINSGGDISFYEDTGTTAKFFWDASAERLGIGTASPAFALDVDGVSNQFAANFTGTTAGYIRVTNDTGYADLGSTGHNMLLRTNGVERARIDSSGNLLVGTASQYGTQKLSVNGGIAIDGRNASNPGLCEKGDTDTGIYWPAANALSVTTGGTERMRIDSSGHVGIGTTPTATLDVNSGSTNEVARFTSTDSTALINIHDNSTTVGTHGIGAVGNNLTLYTAGSEAMRIDSSGNVGIGTDSPAHKLHVNSGSTNEAARFESTDTEVTLELKDTTGTAKIKSRADFRFETGTTPTERMRIDSSGNVGIGTSSPAEELHVHRSDSGQTAMLFTNSTTGSSSSDGLFVGINSSENAYVWHYENKDLRFGTNNTERFTIKSSGTVVFNESGADQDFRVESDSNANMLFVDAGNNRVGINNGSPKTELDVNKQIGQRMGHSSAGVTRGILELQNSGAPGQIKITTDINYSGGYSHAHTVGIKGFVYNSRENADLQISWHVYNNSFYNCNVTNSGSWKPTIKLGVENNKVVIHLSSPGYWPKLWVDYHHDAFGGTNQSTGWTWSNSAISGDSGKPLETVPYSYAPGEVIGVTRLVDTGYHLIGSSASWTTVWTPSFTPKHNNSDLYIQLSTPLLPEASNSTDVYIVYNGQSTYWYDAHDASSVSGWLMVQVCLQTKLANTTTSANNFTIQARNPDSNFTYWNYGGANTSMIITEVAK